MCKVIEDEPKAKKELEVEVLEECGVIQDGNKIFKVQYVRFNGNSLKYTIREYYKDKEGNLKPGRNGITLSGTVLKGIIELFSE